MTSYPPHVQGTQSLALFPLFINEEYVVQVMADDNKLEPENKVHKDSLIPELNSLCRSQEWMFVVFPRMS